MAPHTLKEDEKILHLPPCSWYKATMSVVGIATIGLMIVLAQLWADTTSHAASINSLQSDFRVMKTNMEMYQSFQTKNFDELKMYLDKKFDAIDGKIEVINEKLAKINK